MEIKSEILVVDDTPANLEVIAEVLTTAGYRLALATSGERALKKLQNRLPDLILLDIQMPGINGFQVCEKIKSSPDLNHIPIIFLTALSDTESIVKGFSLGAVDYITKPFREQELLARVQTHLSLRTLTEHLEEQVENRTAELQNRTAELQSTLKELRQAQLRFIQSEKMSALGNLVAGVAHEINNPVGCILGNVGATQNYVNDLLGLLDLYIDRFPEPGSDIKEELDAVDLEYVRDDLPKLIRAMKESGDRITKISKSLRTFSRADTDQKQLFNLHKGIDSTVLILRHRLKANEKRPAIEVLKDYGDIPEVHCFPGQLNQVFMNILANAIDALDDASQNLSVAELKANPQQITIRTSRENDQVQIAIADNGPGIPDEIKANIFDSLFTTKQVGKGTGLGLAIARQIIEDTHSGTLSVHSEIGQGTEFCIRLPC